MPRPDRISTLRYIIVEAVCVTAQPHPALAAAAAAAHFVYLWRNHYSMSTDISCFVYRDWNRSCVSHRRRRQCQRIASSEY